MKKISQEWAQISDKVRVSIVGWDNGTFECAIQTNWYTSIHPFKWEIEEDEFPVQEGLSSMQVYGFIEYQVKPAYGWTA